MPITTENPILDNFMVSPIWWVAKQSWFIKNCWASSISSMLHRTLPIPQTSVELYWEQPGLFKPIDLPWVQSNAFKIHWAHSRFREPRTWEPLRTVENGREPLNSGKLRLAQPNATILDRDASFIGALAHRAASRFFFLVRKEWNVTYIDKDFLTKV